MYTCSLYSPGYIKIDLEDVSLGKELTAAETVLNSPESVVPERTTAAPGGGTVRVAAKAKLKREKNKKYATDLDKPAIVLSIQVESIDETLDIYTYTDSTPNIVNQKLVDVLCRSEMLAE